MALVVSLAVRGCCWLRFADDGASSDAGARLSWGIGEAAVFEFWGMEGCFGTRWSSVWGV